MCLGAVCGGVGRGCACACVYAESGALGELGGSARGHYAAVGRAERRGRYVVVDVQR